MQDFADAGADMFTFHLEAVLQEAQSSGRDGAAAVQELAQQVRDANMHVGIAINPSTPVEDVLPFCPLVDMVCLSVAVLAEISLMSPRKLFIFFT